MKRNNKYLWSLLPGVFTILGNYFGSWWVLSNIIFSLVILAIFDLLLPEDKNNDFEDNSTLPDAILMAHTVLQILSLGCLVNSIQMDRIVGSQLIFAAISTGIHTGSSSIIVAHEMVHRKQKHWQFLGKFLLLTAGNVYFYIDHLKVHHKWVGTSKDPATARKNESVYLFFIRSVIGQTRSAWNVEGKRLNEKGLSEWSFQNYVLRSILLVILLAFSTYLIFGFETLMTLAIQCLLANFLLEYTNYIEHYGLTRPDSTRVDIELSWQSDKVISRFFLIDLSRHSDHHFYASKPYHTLRSHDESPVLPGGYASCIYLALIPPLWFRIMNPRLEIARSKAKGKI